MKALNHLTIELNDTRILSHMRAAEIEQVI